MSSANIHTGHRQRMRTKLLSFGPKIFDSYELLEMLLYSAIPYRDTNPTAKMLLMQFGDLAGVLRATPEELMTVSGVGERAAGLLRAVGRIAEIIGYESFPRNIPVLKNYYFVGDYFVDLLKNVRGPSVYALMLDNDLHPIACECMYELPYGSAGVRPQRFIEAVLRHGAAACFTANYQPYGSVCPTESDRQTDKAIVSALKSAGIDRVNHYVVSGSTFHGIDYIQRERAGVRANDSYAVNSICRVMRPDDEPVPVSIGRVRLSELLSCLYPNATELTDTLLKRYPTVEYMLTPTARELSDFVGDQVAVLLKLVAYVIARSRTDSFSLGAQMSDEDVSKYLTGMYVGTSVETISMLTFDSSDRLTAVRIVAEGTVNSAVAVPRSFLEIAGEMRAKSVIIAHNHPLGNTNPSDTDVSFTDDLYYMFESVGIKMRDHYIVAGQKASKMNLPKYL